MTKQQAKDKAGEILEVYFSKQPRVIYKPGELTELVTQALLSTYTLAQQEQKEIDANIAEKYHSDISETIVKAIRSQENLSISEENKNLKMEIDAYRMTGKPMEQFQDLLILRDKLQAKLKLAEERYNALENECASFQTQAGVRKREVFNLKVQLDMALEVITNSINWDFDGQPFCCDVTSLIKYLKEFLDSLKGDK